MDVAHGDRVRVLDRRPRATGPKHVLRQRLQDSILHPSPCTSGEDFAAFVGKVTVEGSALEVMLETMEAGGKTDNI